MGSKAVFKRFSKVISNKSSPCNLMYVSLYKDYVYLTYAIKVI
jgi:hypothetical protein